MKTVFMTLCLVLCASASFAQSGLDSSFDKGGKVTTDFGGAGAAARTIAVQADGKIFVAGVAVFNGVTDFALARYNSDGTLDASLGTGGIVTTALDFPGSFDRVFTLVKQPDGKFVAVGSTVINLFANFALARFNANGTLDTTFGTGGIVTTGFGVSAEATSGAVQADGKIVAAGYANLDGADDFALVRYNSNGTIDASFGTSGRVTTDFAGAEDHPTSVAIQPDGNIVVAGGADIGGRFDFALVRYVGGSGGGVLTAPDIDTAPTTLAYGNVTKGSFRNLGLTVSNTGTATLNVTSSTLLGPDAAQFSIVDGGGAFSLEPGASRVVTVRFTPTSVGSKAATLRFASNDTDESAKDVPLSGRGRR